MRKLPNQIWNDKLMQERKAQKNKHAVYKNIVKQAIKIDWLWTSYLINIQPHVIRRKKCRMATSTAPIRLSPRLLSASTLVMKVTSYPKKISNFKFGTVMKMVNGTRRMRRNALQVNILVIHSKFYWFIHTVLVGILSFSFHSIILYKMTVQMLLRWYPLSFFYFSQNFL